ncbi:MAG: ribose-5-phosphate isomerase RpiA [Deltaproteobacteria bacterium]|nr:ribose-5-phosphate isomerase RpiA [Deltaproteobacteria bacterium]MBW1994309.1 ribose-5-phosphate isomerase RpiA [Deltaproteobacteria bacterium]
MKPVELLKQRAAFRAAEQVRSGMVVGLGSGSTAKFAVERIGQLLAAGELADIVGIPSSVQTEKLALDVGIPLTTLDHHPRIDITIDGADEVDPNLNLIKGGGGALLREKVLAQTSMRNIIVVDEGKLSPQLGFHWALPVEVVAFARQSEENYLKSLGASVAIRKDRAGSPFVTDQNNLILDANFGPIANPLLLSSRLDARAGIMAHGLFIGLANEVIVAGTGGVRHLKSKNRTNAPLFP